LAVLNDITKIEPDKAKEIGSKIYNRYLEDIEHISDDLVVVEENEEQKPQTIRSGSTQENQLSQQIESSKISNSSNIEILSFDRFQVALPKGDLIKVTPRGWIDKQILREINDILKLYEFAWLSNGKDSCWLKLLSN